MAAQGVREVSQIEILTPELDEGIKCVQDGADAWCYDPKIGRQFAKLSIRYVDAIAPEVQLVVVQAHATSSQAVLGPVTSMSAIFVGQGSIGPELLAEQPQQFHSEEPVPLELQVHPKDPLHCDGPMHCRLQYLQQWDEQPWLVADQSSL